jgi:parvulin-like peptidyl-prolyl isomerase
MAVGGRKDSGRDPRRAVDRLTVGTARPDPPRRRASAVAREDGAPPVPARLWAALLREPLVHFLVLAALLFVAYALLSPSGQDTIVVDRAAIDRRVKEQEGLLTRPLSDEERRAVIETAVDDEVLLREAYRRGLDRDAVVTRHLVQKMRLILGEDQVEPSEAELRTFLASNRERYRTPPGVTLQHVFYADPAAVPVDLLERLRDGADFENLGDRLYMLDATLPRHGLQELIGLLGPEVAQRIFDLPRGGWHGPLTSDRGVHFVRVLDHHPPTEPTFEELEDYLRQDWSLARQRDALAAKLAELRAGYRIVVEEVAR